MLLRSVKTLLAKLLSRPVLEVYFSSKSRNPMVIAFLSYRQGVYVIRLHDVLAGLHSVRIFNEKILT